MLYSKPSRPAPCASARARARPVSRQTARPKRLTASESHGGPLPPAGHENDAGAAVLCSFYCQDHANVVQQAWGMGAWQPLEGCIAALQS